MLETLFLPFARLLVARGVPFRDASEALKRAYLEAARRVGGRTDSRLSILTGLQRREIARLREGAASPEVKGTGTKGTGTKGTGVDPVLIAWRADPRYCDGTGAPRSVPRRGVAPSFEALVRQVRQDVHPRSVLDVLRGTGAVEWDEARDLVRPLQPLIAPSAAKLAKLRTFGGNLGDHAAASVANVLGEGRHFDRALEYGGLTDADVAALETRFEREMMGLLQDLNLEAETRRAKAQGTRRVRFGGYGFWE